MYIGLLHLHSFLRYVLLALLIITIVKSFSGWFGKKSYSAADNKLSLFTMIAAHTQLLLGIILYSISEKVSEGWSDFAAAMKEPVLRFWTVEHISGMLIAITLITIGRITSKKSIKDISKHKKVALYFLCALLLILVSIPWPFSTVPASWF